MNSWDFEVRRTNLRERRVQPARDAAQIDLAPGQALFAIEKVALSANNVTYAALGDALGYWRFFPAPEGWGRVPAWGYARVVRSEHPELAVGERVFGYVPMSTHVVMDVSQLLPASLVDAAPHRRTLPAPYNGYQRVGAASPSSAEAEDLTALFRPLYTTSFLLDDHLEQRGLLETDAVVLTSASSKTAAGLAFLLHRRTRRPRVVGLTSERNLALVESMGSFDEVLPYARVAELARLGASVLIDFAGNATVVARARQTLADRLRATLQVGATHWEGRGAAATLPGPSPEIFFAPEHMRARLQEWGRDGFHARYAGAWSAFMPALQGWHAVERHSGPSALDAAFGALVEGRSDAARSVVIGLQ